VREEPTEEGAQYPPGHILAPIAHWVRSYKEGEGCPDRRGAL